MDFTQWQDLVQVSLMRRRAGFTVTQIPPDVLQAGFDAGESPVIFASRPDIVPRTPIKKGMRLSALGSTILAIGVVAIVGALTYRVVTSKVGGIQFDRLAKRVRYPAELPLSPGGMPPEILEPIEAIEDSVREELLVPKTASFTKIEPTNMLSRHHFQYVGEVEAQNSYGTAVTGRFTITARLLHAESPLRKWMLDGFSPTDQVDVGIWRTSGVFRGVKVPPKKSLRPPFQSQTQAPKFR